MDFVSKFKLNDQIINIKDNTALHVFDTFNDMVSNASVNSTNLIKGFYENDDGAMCLYEVTDSTPDDDVFYIQRNSLYYVLVPASELSFKSFGIVSDENTDVIDNLNTALAYCSAHNITINDFNTYWCKPSETTHRIITQNGNIIKNTTFKLMSGCPGFSQWFQIIGKSDITFENVTFDQNVSGNTNMVINIEPNVMHWWSTFYCENIQNITWNKCKSIHQGIWFVNISDHDDEQSRNITFNECSCERHVLSNIEWYDNTDMFIDAINSHVTNCTFKSLSTLAQTAFELHGPDSYGSGNTITGYRCGIIVTNVNTNSVKKSLQTNIRVSNNVIDKCVYGVDIYPISDNTFDGVSVHDNIILIDHNTHSDILNSYGIGTHQLIDSNHALTVKNVTITDNVIRETDNPLSSSDPFAPTVYTGINMSVNGDMSNIAITGNNLNNISGMGIICSVSVTNAQNKTIHKATVTNNIIDCMANNKFPTSQPQGSAYTAMLGRVYESVCGNNVLKSNNTVVAQVQIAGNTTGDNTLSLLPNFTSDYINSAIIKPVINSANATSNDEMHIYIDSAGMAHINGSFTITSDGNGKTMYTIPVKYCPPGIINLPDAVTINNMGELVSYAGNNNRCYVHATYRPQYNNPNTDFINN